MAARKSNEPQFLFAPSSLGTSLLEVIEFSGVDTISQPYEFSLTLKSQNKDIAAEDILNKGATLFMFREGEYFPYSGIILEFTYVETNVDYSVYEALLVPELKQLDLNNQTRVFQKLTIPEIIKKVLQDNGLPDYFTLDTTQQYEQREFIVQYRETDLNFISRLMEEMGIWYFFDEKPVALSEATGAKNEKMIITDNPAQFKEIPSGSMIKFRTASNLFNTNPDEIEESVFTLSFKTRVIPEKVLVKNYNYRMPEVDLSLYKNVSEGVKGLQYIYGEEYKKIEEADVVGKILSDRCASEKHDARGQSICVNFRAGNRFELCDHQRKACNDKYLIRTVTHKGGHSHEIGVKNSFSYSNNFIGMPSGSINSFKPPLVATIPKVNGILTAQIEASGSEYAGLDDMGRYKVRLPFDLSEAKNYDASKYVRLAQPYSGTNYGMHFPCHEGTEMILACINGNPNRIMGIGTIPNSNTISPVVSRNKTESVVRTAGNNEMIMDDSKGREKLSLKTPHDFFQTAGNNQTITIEKDRAKTIGNNEKNRIKANKTTIVGGTFTETIEDETTIKITKGAYHHHVAGNKSKIEVAKDLDHLVGGDVVERYGSKQKTSVENDITITSEGSKIDIQAATQITLKTGQSSVVMNSDGTIEIKGINITIQGVNVTTKGSVAVATKGGSITSEATVDHNIKGKLVKSDGAVTNIIKGQMVMLNPQ